MMQVGETGHKHIEIGFSISTDDASWETATTQELVESQLTITCKLAGHNIAKSDFQFIQTMQVGGAQHSEIESSISTNNASWGNGPQTQKLAESHLTITCELVPQHRSWRKVSFYEYYKS